MNSLLLSPGMLVAELLAAQPSATGLLLELHLDCPGCSMTRFCSLEEVCRQYEMNFDQLTNLVLERMVPHASNPNPQR